MLVIYNSLNRRKEEFHPIEAGRVGMYVCGMTVYDYCHIGNARPWVVFDVVYRYLQASGYEVTYVRNITDIDDKIIRRAAENEETVSEVTARFIHAMHADIEALGVLHPDVEPRATETIQEMLDMIADLIDKGHAYAVAGGDVYYSVSSFAGYGKLSGKRPAELRAGERVAVDRDKRDPLDFVLWKAAKPGEPSWESPWGTGRPGWHIECSAMSAKILGEQIDIHGGGVDLQFPHHENEIAQSEACHGKAFVNYWMHNGFINVDNEKMSKSVGNFFTVRDVLKLYRPEDVRYFLIAAHYRSPQNFSDAAMDEAKASLTRLYTALRGLPDTQAPQDSDFEKDFRAAMDDDFNTREALAVLFLLATEVNKVREADLSRAAELGALLKKLAAILGLLQQDPEVYLTSGSSDGLSNDAIQMLIAAREQARANRDFARADEIREQLQADGVILEDSAGSTSWRRE